MGASIGTRLYTRLFGARVGADAAGNTYYREKNPPRGRRERRWAIYAGEAEGSAIPPEWQGWLTHMRAESPAEAPASRAGRGRSRICRTGPAPMAPGARAARC